MSKLRYPRPALLLLGFILLAAALSAALVRFGGPDELLILLLIPILYASFYCRRRVYLTMLIVLLGLTVWVTRSIGDNFDSSMETTAATLVSMLVSTEAIHRMAVARRRAEADFLASEERFRRIFERSTIGLALQGADGALLDANPACLRILEQATLDDVRRSGVVEHLRLPDEAQARLATGATVRHSLVLQRPEAEGETDGVQARHLDVTVTPFADSTPDGAGCYLIQLQDMTEQRHLEQQLRQALKLEAIGRLAGGMAHEFNNLLTVINGYAEFVLEVLPPTEAVCADVQQIRKAGERAADLTRRLLAFSRRQPQRLALLNLNEVTDGMARMVRRFIGESVTLELKLAPDLGQIRADVAQVEQMLLNLVTNACDAMPKGGRLTLATENVVFEGHEPLAAGEIAPGRYVALVVSDTGHGMSPQVRAHVFEPFYTTKDPGKGTGLGLATVYGTMRQSGGAIQVDTQLGRGTTVRLLFPRVEVPAVQPESGDLTSPLPRGDETVLLVEDHEEVRALGVRMLQSLGYDALEASDGEAAARLLQDSGRSVDLVLTGLATPGNGGSELAARLQRLQPGVRLLYTAGHDDQVLSGSNGTPFVPKPFTIETLARAVRHALDGQPPLMSLSDG
ncbi:MAG: ATP-binding protein [Anaerolineae bacterium]